MTYDDDERELDDRLADDLVLRILVGKRQRKWDEQVQKLEAKIADLSTAAMRLKGLTRTLRSHVQMMEPCAPTTPALLDEFWAELCATQNKIIDLAQAPFEGDVIVGARGMTIDNKIETENSALVDGEGKLRAGTRHLSNDQLTVENTGAGENAPELDITGHGTITTRLTEDASFADQVVEMARRAGGGVFAAKDQWETFSSELHGLAECWNFERGGPGHGSQSGDPIHVNLEEENSDE